MGETAYFGDIFEKNEPVRIVGSYLDPLGDLPRPSLPPIIPMAGEAETGSGEDQLAEE